MQNTGPPTKNPGLLLPFSGAQYSPRSQEVLTSARNGARQGGVRSSCPGYSKCGLWTKSVLITWERVRDGSQAPPQTL